MSSAYVERRETALSGGAALDGAGKRAAFALYYGPIHFLLVQHIMRELAVTPGAGTIVDLGCGTGVAGAAVATAAGASAPALQTSRTHLAGIDTHPWALDEARFTYRSFGLRGETRRGHAARTRFPPDTSFIVAAFVVNELTEGERQTLLAELVRHPGIGEPGSGNRTGSRLPTPGSRLPVPGSRHALVVEPISRRISPWWPEWERAFVAAGGRSDEWKFRIDPPPIVKRLARAAGLRPEVLTARSLLA